jgi:hypothetical protein
MRKIATVTWTGNIGGLQGFYNGTGVIFLLMNGSFIGRTGSFSVGNVTHTAVGVSADSAVVNSSFDISAQNYNLGFPYFYSGFNCTVSAQDSDVYSVPQSAWLISTETWNFNVTLQSPAPTSGGG